MFNSILILCISAALVKCANISLWKDAFFNAAGVYQENIAPELNMTIIITARYDAFCDLETNTSTLLLIFSLAILVILITYITLNVLLID